jgi:phosphoglycolate phosphatase
MGNNMTDTLFIFDMDGTLVDTREDITCSINYVRAKKGLPPLSVENVIKIINFKRDELPKHLYHTDSYLPEDRDMFENHYISQCTKNVRPFDGITDLLTRLKELGARLSVATNAPTKFAEKILSAANISHYFDFIIGACKVNNPKPAAEMLYLIENKYIEIQKLIFKNRFFLGDSSIDIKAAKNANISSIFVTWGYGGYDRDATPDFVINNPSELLCNIFS